MPPTAHLGEILHCLDDPRNDQKDTWEFFKNGALVVEDGYVLACGDADRLLAKLSPDTTLVKHENSLIVPGMVDTHIHYPQTEVIASYGTQLIEWLETYTFPAEKQFADIGRAASSADFFLAELLRNGTTTALVFGTVHPESVEAFFEAAGKLNLRMICGKVLMDRNAPEWLLDTASLGYQQSLELIRRWHGTGRLGYAVTPRFAPTSTSQQLEAAGKLLQEHDDLYLHTHLSENLKECEWVHSLYPGHEDYLDVYDKFGLLGRRSVFAHGIYLCNREWRRLHNTGSNIAFCPASNLFIGSGLFDLASADDYGVRVGLGTDVGGGDSFSMLRVINQAYKVQQLQHNNLSPIRSLYLATLGGARTLDIEHYIGNFECGKEADFIVLNYAATPLIEYRLAHASDIMEKLFVLQMLGDDRAVRETWVMGKCLYRSSGVRQTA